MDMLCIPWKIWFDPGPERVSGDLFQLVQHTPVLLIQRGIERMSNLRR
jgi:hypothetical protein